MEKTGIKTSLKRTGALLSCLLLCILVLAGCGRSLVITTGFRHGEVFRLGKEKCRIAEMKVYLLDLQKQSEAMYGDAIWESEAKEDLQQAVKDQALAQLTRVKALKSMGVSMNIMLTNEEEDLAAAARNKYFAALSQEEKKYIGLDEKKILKVFEDYALAERMWKSFGDSALQEYEKFFRRLVPAHSQADRHGASYRPRRRTGWQCGAFLRTSGNRRGTVQCLHAHRQRQRCPYV